jgi:hypothetical protein
MTGKCPCVGVRLRGLQRFISIYRQILVQHAGGEGEVPLQFI